MAAWTVSALAICASAAAADAVVADDEFLPPEQAFRYTADSDGKSVTVHWNVAKGYYLYQKRMGIAAASPHDAVGAPAFPQGEIHEDEYFGKQLVHRLTFDVSAPITQRPASGGPLQLTLTLQGCADAGLCYPPQTWTANVSVPASALDQALGARTAVTNDADFLPPDEAFRVGAVADGPDRVRIVFEIADGYYLYRSRLGASSRSTEARLGQFVLPKGEDHEDEYFGRQEIYHGELVAMLPVSRAPGGELTLPVDVTYQGCAEAGLCYPPTTKNFSVTLPPSDSGSAAAAGTSASTGGSSYVSEQDSFAARIASGSLLVVLAIGYLGGLLMAFTPCVLPMVPILSGIIAGGGDKMSPARGFLLSLTYVAGIAVIYVTMGVLAAFIGGGVNLQAIFNQWYILVPFALLFMVLAASMFGLFTIQVPSFIQTRLSDASNNQRAGTFVGVAVMGALSALIVSACVAPVLIGALTFIAKTGDAVRGGITMLAIALGMGTPLVLVGASAGALLPRAGAWMDTIKNLFGVMFLAVAAWLLGRIVPGWANLLLWAATALSLAWVLWRAQTRSDGGRRTARAIGGAAAAYGVVLVVGAGLGATDPLAPIPQLAARHAELEFRTIKTVADLEREVAAAKTAGKTVMLDFYADWCVSCKEMEKYTFTDADVQRALERTVLLRADVTKNDADDQALLKRFGIFGPPTIAFYGSDGLERANFRVVGYMKAAEFSTLAREALGSETVAQQTGATSGS